ncbi:MAG TPA: UDP-glucose/GDP-mannose dehydrogenase family protein, partial [Actinomycetota bacterium]|nr:UDP-glucose/GDP-mannose dehydrogenase family protein [Actinomycetota bacterium]
MTEPLRVAVVGTGHVGLITCASLSAIGHTVIGMDSDEEKIVQLQAGGCPFFEPGLKELLAQQIDSGRLSFTRDIREAVRDADVAFICVGTPPRASGDASLVAVEKAGRAIAKSATKDIVIVEKSTVPAGTAGRLDQVLAHERPDSHPILEVASNPEFLREGNAVQDSLEPDRILVGAHSDWARQRMRDLYEPLIDKGHRYIETDIATAEIAKHACNAFLAMKISFTNALAQISERAGADVMDVAQVMGADPRIGPAFLNAGLGYGGYCFPKDLQAFGRLAHRLGYDFPLLAEIERINEDAVATMFSKVQEKLWNLEDKRVCLLGLSFKPNT